MWRARLLVAVATLAAATLAAACGRHEPAPPAASTLPSGPPVAVTTAPVVTADAEPLSVPAEIRARERATLAARISATVTALPKEIGQTVRAGEVVVTLDDAALRAALTAAEAALTAAETEEARATRLLDRGAATPRERDEAVARAAAARAQVSAARNALAYTVLRAPFAGTVAERHVTVGDVAGPGQPLVSLQGAGRRGGTELELIATVDATARAGLTVGQQLLAHLADRAAPLPVTVTAIAAAGDPTTHRFTIEAALPADPPGGAPRAGVFARLLLPSASPTTAADTPSPLLVPRETVIVRGGLTGLFVVADGRARLRWVAAGREHDGQLEIRAGVVAGEQVVVSPRDLVDGAPVTATPATSTVEVTP